MGVHVQLLMPKFGMTMTKGLVSEWRKEAGQRVNKGEPLLIIETDKVTVELEAPFAGVLDTLSARAGQYVPCGQTIGVLLTDEEVGQGQIALSGKSRKRASGQSSSKSPSAPTPIVASVPLTSVDISPIALKIANERRLDITRIKGTGPEGRISKEDVLRAAEQGLQANDGEAELQALEVIPLRGIRKTICERMHLSRQTAAHFTLTMEVDMTEIVTLREQLAARVEESAKARPTLNSMITMAVARALVEHRSVNCSVVEGEVRVWKQINLGMAVATERGLIVPVIKDADKKSLAEMSEAVRDLAERSRAGALDPDDVTGGTFTVTNLGPLGVDVFTPIINQPESAILGVGRVVRKPVVVDDEVVVRPMMHLSLSIDHRVIDGAPGARFLGLVKALLEEPGWMDGATGLSSRRRWL